MKTFKAFQLTQTGLKLNIVEQIRSVLAHFSEIESAVIYGSRAKGKFRSGSDIDLSLLGEKLTTSVLLNLDHQLDDLMLPYSFDVSIYEKIDDQELKDHIDRVGMLLYSTPAAKVAITPLD